MPRPTKNSVTKKSRRLVTLATTSSVYGKVEIITPAISAPIAVDKPSQAGKSRHGKTPRERADQHQFRQAGDQFENRRQHEPARQERHRQQQDDVAQRLGQRPEGGIFQVRLERQKQDHRDVLQHEHAQRDAARKRFEFALVIKNFDDDDRAAHRRRDREIKRLQPGFRRADEIENDPAQHKTAENLHAAR